MKTGPQYPVGTFARLVTDAAQTALQGQTPPRGDRSSPVYTCPACGAEREIRGQLRAHLVVCDDFRAQVMAQYRSTLN